MITIHKSGIQVSLTAETIDSLRQHFQLHHYIRLPKLLSEELLEEFHQQIENSEWQERIHEHIGVEVCLADPGIAALLNFLWNDQEFFRLIERITGCERIGSFDGRVYRMIPNSGHYDSWHTDNGEDRLVALSMNLTKDLYQGGVLQIRHQSSLEPPTQVPNTEFGNAIVFRIESGFEHRITSIEGSTAKTAFAGWFKSHPDFWSTISQKK
jgi:hypothetical protein